jgi:hypothetical protein
LIEKASREFSEVWKICSRRMKKNIALLSRSLFALDLDCYYLSIFSMFYLVYLRRSMQDQRR